MPRQREREYGHLTSDLWTGGWWSKIGEQSHWYEYEKGTGAAGHSGIKGFVWKERD